VAPNGRPGDGPPGPMNGALLGGGQRSAPRPAPRAPPSGYGGGAGVHHKARPAQPKESLGEMPWKVRCWAGARGRPRAPRPNAPPSGSGKSPGGKARERVRPVGGGALRSRCVARRSRPPVAPPGRKSRASRVAARSGRRAARPHLPPARPPLAFCRFSLVGPGPGPGQEEPEPFRTFLFFSLATLALF